MSLSLEEVEHISALARLTLTDEEKEKYRQQLSSILDYITMLQELDTASIPPTSSVLPKQSPVRADLKKSPLVRDELLSNAPETAEGQFKVPPVFE